MNKLTLVTAFLAVFAVLVLPCWALACPSCAEAPAAGGADEEQSSDNQAAYNNSIYIMVGVPYFSLGVITFLVYRGMKKNEAFRLGQESHHDLSTQSSPIHEQEHPGRGCDGPR